MFLMIGALFGFSAVAFGAYVEHGLKKRVDDETYHFVSTALRYQFTHALVLVAIGLAQLSPDIAHYLPMLSVAAFGFAAGIVLFSMSIFAGALLQKPCLYKCAPAGGITLMAAWLVLTYAGFQMWFYH